MAEQVLNESFLELRRDLRVQGLISQVRTFSGEGHKNFRSWIKDMKRVRVTMGADEEQTRLVALSTQEFLTREIQEEPNLAWDEINVKMTARFSDLADTQYALQALKRIKQKEGENIQAFQERMLELAEEAFPPNEIRQQIIQRQLVDIFIDGVRDNHVAKRLIRNSPATLQAAARVAAEEQVTTRQYALRRREEPMEVDYASKDPKASLKGSRMDQMEASLATLSQQLQEFLAVTRSGATAGNGAYVPRSGAVNNGVYNPNPGAGVNSGAYSRPNANENWTDDNRPICFYCKIPGHKKAECRKFERDKATQGQDKGNRY